MGRSAARPGAMLDGANLPVANCVGAWKWMTDEAKQEMDAGTDEAASVSDRRAPSVDPEFVDEVEAAIERHRDVLKELADAGD